MDTNGGISRPLRLGELLEQEEFGLQLVSGDTGLLDREIVGAHAIDAPNPTRWLDEDWVLLTSGLSLRTTDDQRGLVRSLTAHGIAGLGFTINLYYKQVPDALVEEADKRGLPVFSVPLEVRFSEIIAFIGQSRLSRDTYTLRRAFSIQRYLMEALQTEEPEGVLVERLASVLQGSVLVFDPLGGVVASRGRLPRVAIWQELSTRPSELQKFTSGRWSIVSTPVRTDGAIRYWLVVATQSKTVFEQLGKQAVESAAHLLALIARSHDAAQREQRALKSSLMRDLVEGRLKPLDPAAVERLQTHGFNDSIPCRALVIDPGDGLAPSPDLIEQVESLLAIRHYPALLYADGSELLAMIQAAGPVGDDLTWIHGRLQEAGLPTTIGVGRVLEESTSVVDSLRDARLALASPGLAGRGGGVVESEDLDLVAMTLGLEGSDSVAARARRMLAPVSENEPLMRTLATYFDTGLDVGKTAKRLHLHPNSVRYRLAQIEKHLSMRLDKPDAIANIHLALKVRSLERSQRHAVADEEAGAHADI